MFETTSIFLNQLQQNNNKIWFDQNRARYEEIKLEFSNFVGEILFEISKFDSILQLLSVKDCLYRINRDVRYSKDKSPYKTNIGAVFLANGKNGSAPGYYFQIQPDNKIMIGGGHFQPTPAQLSKIRKYIQENPEKLRKIINSNKFIEIYNSLSDISDLKTHPKGYSSDDVNIDLLKHTNFVVSEVYNLSDFSRDALQEKILENFKVLNPLILFLRDSLK
jgi:uncharacterized protein (TIGR02453 family)